VKRGPEAWKIAALGWSGTLLAGSQVMKLVMQGIHTIYGDTEEFGFLHRQIRGLLLLLATIAPLLGAAILGVLGRRCGDGLPMKSANTPFCRMVEFLFSRRRDGVGDDGADRDLPRGAPPGGPYAQRAAGAMVATMLWWLVDVLFGVYVRRVPYSFVYGGLAAVIGLIIWMQLSAGLSSWAPPGTRSWRRAAKGRGPMREQLYVWSAIPDIKRTNVP